MKYLRFSLRAEKDLADIESYYSKISSTLTASCFNELKLKFDLIQDDPYLFQIRYRGVRISPLQRFPYGIHYKIQESSIIVLRILHFKRYFKQ